MLLLSKNNMNIVLHVHVRSNREAIEIHNNEWHAYTSKPAVDNKANEAIKKSLAEYLARPVSSIELIRGQSSKIKYFHIDD